MLCYVIRSEVVVVYIFNFFKYNKSVVKIDVEVLAIVIYRRASTTTIRILLYMFTACCFGSATGLNGSGHYGWQLSRAKVAPDKAALILLAGFLQVFDVFIRGLKDSKEHFFQGKGFFLVCIGEVLKVLNEHVFEVVKLLLWCLLLDLLG